MRSSAKTCSLVLYLALWAAWLSATGVAHADGPGAYAPREQKSASASQARPAQPDRNAIDAYHAGYALILQAEHAENIAAASAQPAQRETAQATARAAYGASVEKLDSAVNLDDSMKEAYTYLGYAHRKLGRYEQALQAYEQALRIEPDYPPAIEYQGEAFLGAGRLAEARFNYLRLYALSPAQAGKLFRSMQSWVEANARNPPAGVDVDALAAWLDERAMLNDPSASSAADPTGW